MSPSRVTSFFSITAVALGCALLVWAALSSGSTLRPISIADRPIIALSSEAAAWGTGFFVAGVIPLLKGIPFRMLVRSIAAIGFGFGGWALVTGLVTPSTRRSPYGEMVKGQVDLFGLTLNCAEAIGVGAGLLAFSTAAIVLSFVSRRTTP